MGMHQLTKVIHELRTTTLQDIAGLSDGQLLDQFIDQKDESAFATLVNRYSAMVWGVCRRVVGHHHDAEDAFQATFLVLARKASSVRPREMVANWLYGVAHRIALKASVTASKLRGKEKHMVATPEPETKSQNPVRDLESLLDQELNALPDKYRVAILLCDLEGKTGKDVARQLKIPEGTLATRLRTARSMLAKRLARHSIALSSGSIAAMLFRDTATASVIAATIKIANLPPSSLIPAKVAILTAGALKAMLMDKLKALVVMLLLLGIAAFGGGLLAHQLLTSNDDDSNRRQLLVQVGEKHPENMPPVPASDRFGDPCPDGALLRLGTARLRHADGVHGVTYSPDGKMLASIGGDDAIRLWNRKTGRQIRQFNTTRLGNYGIIFSPDGTKLVSGDTAGNICLWEVDSGKRLYEKHAHEGRVHAVAFAPDGRTFASVGGNVCIWNTTTGVLVRDFAHQGRFTADSQGIAFSNDGKLLAASFREKVHVWDIQREAPPVVIVKAHSPSTASLFFANNTTLLSGGYGGVRSWDSTNGQLKRDLKAGGHGGIIALSGDQNVLAAAFWNKIKIWNHRTGESIRDLEDFSNTLIPKGHHLTLSPDGRVVAAAMGDNAVRMWDVDTGKRLLDFADSHTGRINSIVHSPDGRYVLTAGNEGTVRLWNGATAEHVRTFSTPSGEKFGEARAAFSHNGKLIAAVGYTHSPKQSFAGTCRVWDAATGRLLYAQSFPHRANAVSFSPDDKTLAISIWKHDPGSTTSYLWDFQAGVEPVIFEKHTGRSMKALGFLPNGKALASLQDGALVSFDIATKKQTATFRRPGDDIHAAVFSADGKIIVTSALDADCFVIWDVATAQMLRRIQCDAGRFGVLAMSPDGRLLASAYQFNSTHMKFDPAIRVWEMTTGREILRFQPGNTSTMALAFSPQGRTLSSAMADGTALTWNVKPNVAKTVTAEDLQQLWTDLADKDASRAYRAICNLTAFPKTSVPYLKNRLSPNPEINVVHVRRLITQLGSDQLPIRQKATMELEKLGEKASGILRESLAENQPLEVRRRVEQLLAAAQEVRSAETLRRLRAIQSLEDIGSADASQILDALANGFPDARETQDAKAALVRLGKRR